MTIDERLEKLAERHEALTESVEMLRASQAEKFEETDLRFKQVAALFAQTDFFIKTRPKSRSVTKRASRSSTVARNSHFQNRVTSVKWKSRTFMAGTTMSALSSPDARTEGDSISTLDSSSIRL
jgi:hypothetical protein